MAPVAVEPLVLLANADKWLTESLESVLTQGGYRVIGTAKRQQVLDLARRQLQDGIRQLAAGQIEHLLALGRTNNPIPALREHALERFGQPFVGVRQQHQRLYRHRSHEAAM